MWSLRTHSEPAHLPSLLGRSVIRHARSRAPWMVHLLSIHWGTMANPSQDPPRQLGTNPTDSPIHRAVGFLASFPIPHFPRGNGEAFIGAAFGVQTIKR
jgi:hypothetical protein